MGLALPGRFVRFALVGIVFLGIAGAWWVSYLANRKLITDSELEVAQYKALAEPLMQEPVVADTDLMKTLDVLHKLKHVPVGYGFRDYETPWSHTFGLSQRERLLSSSTAVNCSRLILPSRNCSRAVLNSGGLSRLPT